MAWAKLTTKTQSSANSFMTTDVFSEKKIIQMLTHNPLVFNNLEVYHQFGKTTIDTSTNYAYRKSRNGGADSTSVSQSYIYSGNDGGDIFEVLYMINISTEEKLCIIQEIDNVGTGSTVAPSRNELVAKWANTSNQMDIAKVLTVTSGRNIEVNCNLTVLTGDETETVTLQDGTIFEESDTNKAYIWNASTTTWTQL